MTVGYKLQSRLVLYSMEKLSSFISKKVISLREGNDVGYVLNLAFDEELKALKGFIVVDDESEHTFMVRIENVKNINDECIVIYSNTQLEFYLKDDCNNPIGKIVYDKDGVNLGRVVDVIVSGRVVKKIITDKCEFLQRYIYSIGDFIIYGTKGKKTDFKFNRQDEYMPKVYIQQAETNIITNDTSSSYPTGGQSKPYRITANQNILTGRVATSDIFGLNNEIIVKKNEKITTKIINKAKLHNKLGLLIYYSK